MRKFWKVFISTLLVIMSMTCTVFAKVDLNIKTNGPEVIINGSSDHKLQNVMIQTWNGDKKYHIDIDKTDKDGNFNFKFKTVEDMDFNGKANVGGELKDFTFSTKAEVKVESIQLNKTNLELKEGNSEKLTVSITPENATNKNLIWKSSNEKVATVNEFGEVKAIKEGKAEIEVATEDGSKKDKCIVAVLKESGGSSSGGTSSGDSVSVYIRVEGYEETFVPRTKVNVKLFNLNPYLGPATGSSAEPSTGWDLNKFKNPTNAHAIAQLLKDRHIDFDLQDYGWGVYMAMIGGDREFNQGPMSGWMYSVNGKLPPVGAQGTTLRDGDEIVWYYGAYGFDNIFTTLKADKTSVKAGEEISLTLSGFRTVGAGGSGKVDEYGQVKENVSDATILVDGEEYKVDEKVVKTDENGKATIKFDSDGSYKLSVIRYKTTQGKKIDIVRPEPVVIKVGNGGGSSGGGSSAQAKKQEEKALIELQKKLDNIAITENELNIEKLGDKQIVIVSENIITSKAREADRIINSIKEKYTEAKLSDDVKIIPIKINNKESKNTIFRLNGSSASYLSDKEFGVKVSFNDSEIKLPSNKIKNVNLYENIEVRKNAVKEDIASKVVNSMSAEDKVASPVYNIELYKIGKDGEEEKLDLKGTRIGVKFNSSDFKNISKNSLKINFYDSKEKKFVVLKSKFIPESNMVVGEIK